VARPKRSLGQNFLVDPNIQRKIVEAVAPEREDTIVEVGPGRGALTRLLAGTAGRLIAVELDDALAADLAREFDGRDDVTIVHADIMQLDLARVAGDPNRLRIVGNIPYNITTPLIFHLLDLRHRPATIVLMIQREVADRILAPPGDREYGALSVGVRAVAAVDRLFHVGRGAFRPVPNVDSTVLRISPVVPAPLNPQQEADLRALTRAAFAWRRKQLQKTLRAAPEYALDAAEVDAVAAETGIALAARPEDLAPEQFIALCAALRARGLPATT
jgi:16S rRNA (adenine1518-N6/adenine1519-N6)-dimethyltransferase